MPVCQRVRRGLTSWHRQGARAARHPNHFSLLVEWRLARRLLYEPLRMWNQPAQSPFRRFAAAQVDGTSGASSAEDPGAAARSADAGIVLVVDDEPAIVESLTKIFKREGMTVLTATDGTAGLDVLRKHRVGVLLTD